MKDFAIIAVGYNRPYSMKRLLHHLEICDYGNDLVDLIVSIDYSGTDKVKQIAESMPWSHGRKIINAREERLGLRSHILSCGGYTKDYKAIAMFEDDIVPSLCFYQYAKQAAAFYNDDKNIAGISLYQHQWNVGNNLSFIPDIDIHYDNYFMQYAQSWGQVWTTRMWEEFYQWYEKNHENFDKDDRLPDNVAGWPHTSWLKYFIRYVVYEDKYFVYPNIALSTNCGEAGQNNNVTAAHYQVPLLQGKKSQFCFVPFSKATVSYDVYFERNEIAEALQIPREDICIDLYGMKHNYRKQRYWLTLEHADYKIVQSFSYSFRPQERNIFMKEAGNDIFLYDTAQIAHVQGGSHSVELKKLLFSARDIRLKQSLSLSWYLLKESLLNKWKHLMKKRRKKK